MVVSTAAEMAQAIREFSGTDATISWGRFELVLHQVAPIDRLEFFAHIGDVRSQRRSTFGWYSLRELVAAEGARGRHAVPLGFKSWDLYLLQAHKSRDAFALQVEQIATEWAKMPKKYWPR